MLISMKWLPFETESFKNRLECQKPTQNTQYSKSCRPFQRSRWILCIQSTPTNKPTEGFTVVFGSWPMTAANHALAIIKIHPKININQPFNNIRLSKSALHLKWHRKHYWVQFTLLKEVECFSTKLHSTGWSVWVFPYLMLMLI